jgi:hypothetical protein
MGRSKAMNGLHARIGAVHAGPWRPACAATVTALDAARRKSLLLRLMAWLQRPAQR